MIDPRVRRAADEEKARCRARGQLLPWLPWEGFVEEKVWDERFGRWVNRRIITLLRIYPATVFPGQPAEFDTLEDAIDWCRFHNDLDWANGVDWISGAEATAPPRGRVARGSWGSQ